MRFEPASEDHIPRLAATMREADRTEVAALGRTPEEALHHALSSSLWALTAVLDEPEAMLGVSPINMIDGIGCPWMLGSEAIYDNARALVRYGPSLIAEMESALPRLANYVSADNERAIRFLKHWNWEISECRLKMGGVDFVRFSNRV